MTQGAWLGALQQPRGMGWGGGFKREGTCIYLWLIHVSLQQKPTQFCKVIILIKNKLIFLKKKIKSTSSTLGLDKTTDIPHFNREE